eukprot:scaffold19869_cov136-Skeletonema_dohrnii-CCMP3373.AAC.6
MCAVADAHASLNGLIITTVRAQRLTLASCPTHICKRHGAFKDVPPTTVQEQDEESWGGDDQAMTEHGDSDGELGGENIDTREDDRVRELECENQALKAKLAEMAAKLAAAESQNARMMV